MTDKRSKEAKQETVRRKAQRAALGRLASRPINPDVKVMIVRGSNKL